MRFVEAMEPNDIMYGQASATLQRFGHMVDLVIERQCALGRRMYLSILGMSLLVQRLASSRPNGRFRAAPRSAPCHPSRRHRDRLQSANTGP